MSNRLHKKVEITNKQRKEFQRLNEQFKFQDEFITASLLKLQQNKDPIRYGRLSRLWENSKQALAAYAKQGDLLGFEKCIHANQEFIDQMLVGKINLFNSVDQ